MTADLTGLCRDHSFETAENICRRCGIEYCELCLVYPFGAKKPLCKECAMVAGGVRAQGSRPEMPKRDLKHRIKAWNARTKGAAKKRPDAAEVTGPILHDPLMPTEQDLARAPVTVPDDADVAAELAADFTEATPPQAAAPSGPAGSRQEPADGVAPPIDWSQPFG